jgi:hypothetical protein
MKQTGVSGTNYNYSSIFQGVANTSLPIANIAPLYWANKTLGRVDEFDQAKACGEADD